VVCTTALPRFAHSAAPGCVAHTPSGPYGFLDLDQWHPSGAILLFTLTLFPVHCEAKAMKILLRSVTCICFLVVTIVPSTKAQSGEIAAEKKETSSWLDGGHLSIQAGLFQPLLLSGANLAAAYRTDRLVFEYSHGMWLNYDRVGRTGIKRDQNLDLYNPWTTGFGIGYRLPWRFDIRAEFKAHRYRVWNAPNKLIQVVC
jgi:hypothetical protein